MAQKVQTLLIDDLDGGEADGTVRFGIDGTDYEIDLSARHAEALRKALGPYLGAARRASGSAARRLGRGLSGPAAKLPRRVRDVPPPPPPATIATGMISMPSFSYAVPNARRTERLSVTFAKRFSTSMSAPPPAAS